MGRGRPLIVTREIAHTIYKSYEALRLDGVGYKEAYEIIQSDVLEDFSVRISLDTVRVFTSMTFDKYREVNNPVLPRNPDISFILDVFTDDKLEYTAKEVWKIVGGNKIGISSSLNAYAEAGILTLIEGRPKRFKRNPESPFYILCGGKVEETEKGILKG